MHDLDRTMLEAATSGEYEVGQETLGAEREEFFEVLTWAQLGEHTKPCGLLNVAGYYDPLLAVFDHMVGKGFLSESNKALVIIESDPKALLAKLERYRPPETIKWLGGPDT